DLAPPHRPREPPRRERRGSRPPLVRPVRSHRARTRRPKGSPRLRRRTVLPGARRRGSRRHRARGLRAATLLLARRCSPAFRGPRHRLQGARGRARGRRPGRKSRACPTVQGAGVALDGARAAGEGPGRRASAQARARELSDRGDLPRRRILHACARHANHGLARRRGRVVPDKRRAPRDGPRGQGLQPSAPPRLRRRGHRADAGRPRPPRAARPLARLGARAPRHRREHRLLRAHRRGGVLCGAVLRHGAARGRARAAPLARRPILFQHVGALAPPFLLPLRCRGRRLRAREPGDARPATPRGGQRM
ncbi:Catechol 2,3-dioxygenase, partial [uncultured Rubrobacteraceae bacterium]